MNSIPNEWMKYWESRKDAFSSECLAELQRFETATRDP